MEKLVLKSYNCQDCQEKHTLGRTLDLSIGIKSPNSPNKSFLSIKNQDPTHIVPGGWIGTHYLVYSRNFHIHQLILGGGELG